jgi:two-component system response regulator BaeR
VNARVLLVEDDPHIADVVAFLLAEAGHSPRRAADGSEGWRVYQEWSPDLVILDLGLPGIPGLDLFRCIRGLRADQPVIMLTARGETAARVKGLELGADDYIAKPFDNAELAARVRNLLQRCPPRSRTLQRGPLRLEPESFRLEVNGVPLTLPRNECRMLAVLMSQPERVFSREQLLLKMYPDPGEVADRAVDQAAARLRRRLQPRLAGINPIVAEYGIGYKLGPLT